MTALLQLAGLYLIGEFFHTSRVKSDAIAHVNSIQGNKLSIGAAGKNQLIMPVENPNLSEKCDVCPDESRNISYCNIMGPMPYYIDKQFDVVFASHVLEHIDPEYVRQSLKELERIGKEIVIVLPHPLCQSFYTTSSHKSLIYKMTNPYSIIVRNNPLHNNMRHTDTIELDSNTFKIYQ